MVFPLCKSAILPKTYFIFALNYFEFNDESYIQAHATAMRTSTATIHTNVFMWKTEKYLLDNCTDKPFLYLRYIDDIFVM